MTDRIDRQREDSNRIDRERSDRNRERPRTTRTDFAVRYAEKVKTREKEIERPRKEGEKGKEPQKERGRQPVTFSRVVEALARQHKQAEKEPGKESEKGFQGETKKDEKRFGKKDDDEKDQPRLQTDSHGEEKETDHARIESTASTLDKDKGSGGGGGFGGGEGFSGRGQGDSSGGFSGSEGGDSSEQEDLRGRLGRGLFGVKKITRFETQGEGASGGDRHLRKEQIDEIVKVVRLSLNHEGEKELEIEMADQFFSGLKLKASTSPSGVVVTLMCPDQSVMKRLLVERPKIYQALKDRKIPVARVDVVCL